MASNRAALVGRFCRAARNSWGFSRRAVASMERFVVSLSVPATSPTAPARSARASTLGSRGVADDHSWLGLAPLVGFDDGDLEARCPQVRGHLSAEAAVAAHHPPAVGRRMAALGQLRARAGLEPGEQLVGRRRVQREPQMVAESVERVDHRRCAEGAHPLRDRGRDGPRDDGQVGPQQRRRHGDREVGLVVVGQRQHAGAEGMVETGCAQVVRVGGVGHQARDVGVVGPEIEGVDPVGRLVDHHELLAERVEGLGEQLAGAAVAGQQQERLPQPRHLAR